MEEEQAVEPVIDPRINVPEYRPAFQVGPTLDRGAEDEKQASFIKAIRAFHMSLRLAQTLEEPSKPTAPKPRF